MRTLVALAVIGLCAALPHQAYNTFSSASNGYHHANAYQPKWTGPLASSVPAGVDGKVTQVADTYEVAAARDAFFAAYQKQLSAVAGGSGHYTATPIHHHAASGHHFVSNLGHNFAAPSHPHAASTHHYATAHHHASPVQHVVVSSGYQHTPSYSSFAPAHVVVSNGHVQDTPEVSAAKAQFAQLYNKQAAAAAAAPDDYNIHGSHGSYNHGIHY